MIDQDTTVERKKRHDDSMRRLRAAKAGRLPLPPKQVFDVDNEPEPISDKDRLNALYLILAEIDEHEDRKDFEGWWRKRNVTLLKINNLEARMNTRHYDHNRR